MSQVCDIILRLGITPNRLTLSRIVGIPFLIFLARMNWHVPALSLFLILAATDAVDGWLARRSGMVTRLGKFLDPMADKIFLITALAFLLPAELLVGFVILAIVESALFIVSSVAFFTPDGGRARLGANVFGKSKAILETLLIIAVFFEKLGWPLDEKIIPYGLFAAIAAASGSFVGHLRGKRGNQKKTAHS